MGAGSLDLSMVKVFDKESDMKVVRASKANVFYFTHEKTVPIEDKAGPRSDSKLEAELRVEHRSPLTIQQWV